MIKRKISEIISNIDEEYICEATDYVRIKSRPFLEWIKGKIWLVGLVVLIMVGASLIPALIGWNPFKKEPEKLVICTDYRTYEYVDSAIKGWKVFGEEYSTTPVEIIRIPKDETAAEIKITEIRTEIMAGHGPDLFILQTDAPNVMAEDRMSQMLFPNPEKMLHSDIFLPLDSFLNDAKYINIENCNQTVLKAGQTEEGQLLLPLIYDYYACIFPENESGKNDSFPTSWEEICNSSYLGEELRNQNLRGFLVALGSLADYKNEKLLISEDDLLKLYRSSGFAQRRWDDSVRFTQVSGLEFLERQLGTRENKAHTFYAVPNVDGGVTANVSVYAGMNRNTKFEKEAFSLLDYFYKCAKEESWFNTKGIFIEQDEFLLKSYLFKGVSQADISAFLEMNENITTARFYSTWDYALWDEFLAQGRKDPKPLEHVVKELYQTMQMELKE